MGQAASRVAHRGIDVMENVSQEDRRRFTTDMVMLKVAGIIAMAIAVIIPIATLSWIAFLCLIPLGFIGYEVFRLGFNAQPMAEVVSTRFDTVHSEASFIDTLSKGTLLLRIALTNSPSFAGKMHRNFIRLQGIRGL